jgi:hypothetical protein
MGIDQPTLTELPLKRPKGGNKNAANFAAFCISAEA